ncbi:MAG: DUF1330 domain-containing protein [Myxococcota bacterium]
MPAYIIAFVDIHDRARFAQEYLPGVAATFEPYGGRLLAASDEPKTLEGAVPPGRTVILEFPDLDSAHNWYASDAYAPLLALRESIATTALIALPGGLTAHD